MIFADLHSHSTASDGVDPPARVVERAAAVGLKAMSLTDHDSVAGVEEAIQAGRRLGVEVIPGAEMTCNHEKYEIHMLAYGVDHRSAEFQLFCEQAQRDRIGRAEEMSRRLAELGVPVDMKAVMASADGGSVGRPHVARALLDAGHVATFEEAFDKYLGNGKPAYFARPSVPPAEVIALIHRAGGIAVLAHPIIGDQLCLLPMLKKAGLDGVEVWHSHHTAEETERILVEALNLGLVKTGGSDCHGALSGREASLGTVGLDEPRYRKFRASLERWRDTLAET